MTSSLENIRILDLTRVLAGPVCTQLLGDLGANVIKVERPAIGDDTRKWGPPYLKDGAGNETSESSYYLSANRNKRSITLDLAKPEGQAIAKRLLEKSDFLVENFKVGTLKKYGLAYDQLKPAFPALIYCSITGFGQTGPYAHRAGYDYLAQAMGGLMSITGEPEGSPLKVGRRHRRHHGRHVCGKRHAGGAASARCDGRRPIHRHRPFGFAGRLAHL